MKNLNLNIIGIFFPSFSKWNLIAFYLTKTEIVIY